MVIKINDDEIAKKLEAIRTAMGADKADYQPRPPARRIEMDLEGKSVETLFHASGLLIRDNRPVIAYIPDNSYKGFWGNPYLLNRVHIAVCHTLRQMKKKGRWDKYRITNRDDDLYPIDIHRVRKLARLYPCKHCLAQVDYKCWGRLSWAQRSEVVKSFSAKEAQGLLQQQFDIFKGLKPAEIPTGYARIHSKISRDYRARKNFTCEKCGVKLAHAERCADTHHINRVKNDNRDENLQCLCKLCHAEEHPHYRVSADCRHIIEQARRQQGITIP